MHLMIDLETLDTASTAVITQVGWAAFNLEPSLGDKETNKGMLSYGGFALNGQHQLRLGRTISADTVAWWLTQDDEPRNTMSQSLKITEDMGRGNLKKWLARFDWSDVEGVWGHGATFDITLLESLLKTFAINVPWNFRAPRDTRTIFALVPSMKWEKPEVPHVAMWDAVAQARNVQRALGHIRDTMNMTTTRAEF